MEQLLLSSLTHTHTDTAHTLEPMGGEERSHIRAQPCLIMDLMETVSAQSVSTCAAPDSSQLLFYVHTVFTHIYPPPRYTPTHRHTQTECVCVAECVFACINVGVQYIRVNTHRLWQEYEMQRRKYVFSEDPYFKCHKTKSIDIHPLGYNVSGHMHGRDFGVW